MADILDEIKDDIKQERYERLITVHGPKILAAAAILVLCVAVHKIYKSYKYEGSVEKGKIFYDAFEDSKPELYEELINSDHEGYKILSVFNKAGVEKSGGEIDKSIATLEKLNDGSFGDKAMHDYSNLSRLYLLTTSEDKWKGREEEIISGLEKLSSESSPFATSAKQVRAMFLHKIGQNDKARELFSELALLENVPPSVNERARKFIKIIDGQ